MSESPQTVSQQHSDGGNLATFDGENVDAALRAVFIVIGGLEVLSGVIGNCLLLTVLLTRRSLGMRSFHNLFIANLALADLLTLGYWMTFFVLDLILGYHPVVNQSHCVANGFLIAMCLSVGVLSLLGISLNRYLHVCHNHLYARVFTKGRIIAWCVLLWGFGALLALPPLLGAGIYGYSKATHICSFKRGDHDLYPKTMIAIFTAIPMCLVGYFNFAIFRYWKLARCNLTGHNRWAKHSGKTAHTSKCFTKKGTAPEEIETTELKQDDDLVEAPDADEDREHSHDSREPETEISSEPLPHENEAREEEEETGRDQRVVSPPENTKTRRSLRQSSYAQKLQCKQKSELMREKAFVRSLCVVFLLMLFCFFPFGVVMVVDSVRPVSAEVAIASNFVLFFGCSVNWVVYGVLNRSFRQKYVTLLRKIVAPCCRGLRWRDVQEDTLSKP